MTSTDQQPKVIHTRKQATELGLPGADRMCTRCGTHGAKYLRHLFLAGYGVVQLCHTHEAAPAVEVEQHRGTMQELTAPNFQQEAIPASLKKSVKPWQESMHAQEVRGPAVAHGLTLHQGLEKSYELTDPPGARQFFVTFNSLNEFLHASTRGGVNFAADNRSHTSRTPPDSC